MEEEVKYLIYCHRNKINNKRYIGQTYLDIEHINERWKNGRGYDHSRRFRNAIKKWGWENFEHIILETNIPESQIDERERYWIAYYHTWIEDPQCWGYNLQSGGSLHKRHSEETKELLKQLALGRKMSEEAKQKMREAKSHMSEETRKKMSESAKTRIWDQDIIEKRSQHIRETSGKKVICIETGKEYETLAAAAKDCNYSSPSHISAACRGLRKTAAGYHWQFIEKEKGEKTNE